jgi:thiol-disulfide isomerase/thioredoxin
MKKTLTLIALIFTLQQTTAQTITGVLKYHAGQELSLEGFNNYKTVELAKTLTDSLGNFTLNYPKAYKGMALLKSQDKNSLVLLLNQTFTTIKGTHISETDSLQLNATENKLFFNYATGQGYRTNAVNAWKYLDKLYNTQTLFKKQEIAKNSIQKELKRIKAEDTKLVNSLDKNSYLAWFIPIRKLIQETPTIMRTETERIPEAIAQFRNTNFNNPNFKTSGVLREYIEKHYFLIENMGLSIDSVAVQMNLSSNALINNIKDNKGLLNKISENLFTYLEKRSLYKSSEYLAVTLLKDHQKDLDINVINRLEKYVALKVGNTAPDIQLTNSKLSNIKKPILLVFGASWCPLCKTEALELLKYYDAWKSKKDVEVVYISIDTDKEAYKTAYQNAPWQSYCDYKGWDTKAAKDYFVNATPTYILLDKDMKILVHPSSIGQVDAWVNYRL